MLSQGQLNNQRSLRCSQQAAASLHWSENVIFPRLPGQHGEDTGLSVADQAIPSSGSSRMCQLVCRDFLVSVVWRLTQEQEQDIKIQSTTNSRMMVDMAQYQLLQLSQEYQEYLLMTGYQEYLYQEYYQQEYLAMQQYLHQLQALYAAPPPSPPPALPQLTHAHQEAPLDLSRTKAKAKASSGCRCPVCGKIFTRAWLLKGGSRTGAAN